MLTPFLTIDACPQQISFFLVAISKKGTNSNYPNPFLKNHFTTPLRSTATKKEDTPIWTGFAALHNHLTKDIL